MFAQPGARADHHQTGHGKVRQRVASQNRPEKIFRGLEVVVEPPRIRVAGAHQPADADTAEREHAGLHSRKEKREAQAHDDENEQRRIHFKS